MKNTNNIQRVWQDIDLGETHPSEIDMMPTFLAIARESKKILEIGVGHGRMIEKLRTNGTAATFYCLDIIHKLVQHSPGYGTTGDCRSLPFRDNAFDLTYSLGVIEHFPESFIALKEHARVTKRGGYILITTPHLGVDTILRRIIYIFFLRKKYNASFEVVLGRNLSLRYVKKCFTELGLNILCLSASGSIIPVNNHRIQKVINGIPFNKKKYGAYLWCLAKKS